MITSFKELNVWKKSNRLAHRVFDLSDTFPRKYLFDLTSQTRRAVLSVPTNIAEGCASVYSREFLQFLNIARRSLSETEYLLLFASERSLVGKDEYVELEKAFREISKMLNGLMKSIHKHNT